VRPPRPAAGQSDELDDELDDELADELDDELDDELVVLVDGVEDDEVPVPVEDDAGVEALASARLSVR
jgi:hypothetical protein